jgi:hypothetical protein
MTNPFVKSSKFSTILMPIIYGRIEESAGARRAALLSPRDKICRPGRKLSTKTGDREHEEDTPALLARRPGHEPDGVNRLPDLGHGGGTHAAFGALFGAPGSVHPGLTAVSSVTGIDVDGSGRRHRGRRRRRRPTGRRSRSCGACGTSTCGARARSTSGSTPSLSLLGCCDSLCQAESASQGSAALRLAFFVFHRFWLVLCHSLELG